MKLSRGDFAEALFVIGVIGAHPAIPVVEVESEVPLKTIVVLDVVSGSVEEFAEPAIHQPAGMEFVAGVARDVEGDLPKHEEAERSRVDGEGECYQWKNAGLNHGFGWTEAIRRPGAGVVALVMNLMEEFEQLRVMNQSMRPIEVRIMNEDHDNDAAPKPCPAVFINIFVEFKPAALVTGKSASAYDAVDDDGE